MHWLPALLTDWSQRILGVPRLPSRYEGSSQTNLSISLGSVNRYLCLFLQKMKRSSVLCCCALVWLPASQRSLPTPQGHGPPSCCPWIEFLRVRETAIIPSHSLGTLSKNWEGLAPEAILVDTGLAFEYFFFQLVRWHCVFSVTWALEKAQPDFWVQILEILLLRGVLGILFNLPELHLIIDKMRIVSLPLWDF